MAATFLAGTALVHFCLQHSAEPSIRTVCMVHRGGDCVPPGERGSSFCTDIHYFIATDYNDMIFGIRTIS